jgi:hypothetical protein
MKIEKLIVFLFFLFHLPVAGLCATGNIPFADESILLQTDRNLYISGENLFFKLNVIDKNTHKPSTISRIAYLVLRNSKSQPIANICIKVLNGSAFGSIYLADTLATGPYQLVAFTNWMKNRGESSFFYKEIFIANLFDNAMNTLSSPEKQESDSSRILHFLKGKPESALLSIFTDKTAYQRNEKISLKFGLKNSNGNVSANLSVSVHEASPVNVFDLSAGNSVISLNSNPAQDIKTQQQADYLPEIGGRVFRGRIVDQFSDKGAAGCRVILSAFDSVLNLQYADSDTSGLFTFLLNDYYNGKEFMISVIDSSGRNQFSFIPEDNFKIRKKFLPDMSKWNSAFKEFVKMSQNIVYIRKNYGIQQEIIMKQQPAGNLNIPCIYDQPDSKIYTADYVPLKDFVEISRELLPTVKMRKQFDNYSLSLTDLQHQGYFRKKPAVFLNGVLIDDVNRINTLGSDQIERVEVINSQVVCGSLLFAGGILAIFTKEKEIYNRRNVVNALIYGFGSFAPYTSLASRQNPVRNPESYPDFRQLICWDPDIRISGNENKEVEFYASDHTGSYIIEIEGITSEGVVINSSSEIIIR